MCVCVCYKLSQEADNGWLQSYNLQSSSDVSLITKSKGLKTCVEHYKTKPVAAWQELYFFSIPQFL